MTKDEKIALNQIAELGCIICATHFGVEGTPAELHHCRRYGSVRSASEVLPLCPEHHRGNSGVHGLGVKGFERKYQTSYPELLEQVSKRLGKETTE
jgi:hypothetical protein